MFRYTDRFLIVGLMLAMAGCQSAPNSKNETVTIDLQDPTLACIGLGPDPSSGLIARCNLERWADVPAEIEKEKRIAVKIGEGEILVIPCKPNTPWVGFLENGLVAKCRNNKIRLYWKRRHFEKGPTVFGEFNCSECFGPNIIVHNGARIKKYLVYGFSEQASLFLPIDSKNPKASHADMIIADVLEDLNE